MNILIITPVWNPNGEGSGLTYSIKPVVDRMLRLGHDITILTLESSTAIDNHDLKKLEVIRIRRFSAGYLQGFSIELINYILKNDNLFSKYDIIHMHMYSNLFALSAIIALRFLKIDTNVLFTPHYHGITDSKIKDVRLKLYSPLGKTIITKANKIVCVSDYEASKLRETFKVSSSKINVIPHGSSITLTNGVLKYKNESKHVKLLYVGRLVKHKGIQHILKGLYILKNNYHLNVMLDVVGSSGNYEKQLKSLAKSLSIEDNINWNGYVSEKELEIKYKESDIFLLLSWAEAYGLVVADALAYGIPCIVSNVSALSEFIKEPGCFGIEYPPDPEKLASLIFKIHTSDVQVGPFNGNKIRSWDKVAEEYEILYNKLMVDSHE